jgi:transcriptional regulator with XRE-family HTH domain
MKKNEKGSTRSTGRFSSVLEMVRATADKEFADEFEQTLRKSRVVNTLVLLRVAKGMTQKELGDKLGRTQGWVSKIENSLDEEIGFGNLTKYAAALGSSTGITFIPNDTHDIREGAAKLPNSTVTTGMTVVDVEVCGTERSIESATSRKQVRKPRKAQPAV